ncbi:MAG: hypothetical protein LUD57_07360, partial [Ruminococcus sp.]|nr:hypothetical protein [Ruminococcus sp.]
NISLYYTPFPFKNKTFFIIFCWKTCEFQEWAKAVDSADSKKEKTAFAVKLVEISAVLPQIKQQFSCCFPPI